MDNADEQILDLTGQSGTYSVEWYDPVEGGDLQSGSVDTISGGDYRTLGRPPSSPDEDWVVLIRRR